jgi:phosphate-selective porin OprO/OprP
MQKTMKLTRSLIIALGTAQFTAAALADDEGTNSDTDVRALKQQIEQLEQKVDVLEYQQEKDHKAVVSAATNSAHLTVGTDGVNFISANSNFVAGLHGVLQVDSRTFFQNGATPGLDGFLLRRARLIFQGSVYKNFDYYFQSEFAGSGAPQILDAYINYRYVPELQLQVGKYKPPVGLEQLQSDATLLFNERALATDLMPYRSIGAELHGDIDGGVLSYAAGIFNGLPDYTTTTINNNIDNDVAFAGRVFVTPFKQTSIAPLQGLGLGVSGTFEHDDTNAATAGLTPGFTTDGQEKFFAYSGSTVPDGIHWRLSPQAYYYYGPVGLEAEYAISDQQVARNVASPTAVDLHNTAWEVSASWVLTGENASYNGVTPRHPFDFHGGWGAWQVAGRFAELDLDQSAFPATLATQTATGARAWSVGLNWYLNKNLRTNLSFSRTWFVGNTAPSAVTLRPENVLFTRMQVAF